MSNNPFPLAARAGLCESQGGTNCDQLQGGDQGQVRLHRQSTLFTCSSLSQAGIKSKEKARGGAGSTTTAVQPSVHQAGEKGHCLASLASASEGIKKCRRTNFFLTRSFSGVFLLQHSKACCCWLQRRSEPDLCVVEPGGEQTSPHTSSTAVLPRSVTYFIVVFIFLSLATNKTTV